MNPFDERLAPIVSGVAGGLTGALLMVRARLIGNWREFVSVALTGMLFATFVVPAVCDAGHIQSVRVASALGYLGGAFGNLLMLAAVVYISDNRHGLVVLMLARLLRVSPTEMPDVEQKKEADDVASIARHKPRRTHPARRNAKDG